VLRYYVVDFIIIFGVVIATEKKLPSILVDESSVSKHLLLVLLVLLCSLVEIQETLLFFFFFCVFYCVFFVNFSGWPCFVIFIGVDYFKSCLNEVEMVWFWSQSIGLLF
jgi:hypothetical protein